MAEPRPFQNAAVERVFRAYPPRIRAKLMALRQLIFETAEAAPGAGEILETLKWGELAYVPAHGKPVSAIRIGWKRVTPASYAIYFPHPLRLVERFRARYPKQFKYEGNRAIVFEEKQALPAARARPLHSGRTGSPPVIRACGSD